MYDYLIAGAEKCIRNSVIVFIQCECACIHLCVWLMRVGECVCAVCVRDV